MPNPLDIYILNIHDLVWFGDITIFSYLMSNLFLYV